MQQPAADDRERLIAAYVEQRMAKHGIPGLALAIVRDGGCLLARGYGLASVEFGIPADEHSVFQLYSTSKIFASIAIMLLVEDGLLSLDTPVTRVVTWLPHEWEAIRVWHLLSHTSGLRELSAHPRVTSLSEAEARSLPAEEATRLVAELPLKFAPGQEFAYHRSGYTLLGLIVERLAGMAYADFLAERVFTPLGMGSTCFGDTEAVVLRRPATAYNRESGALRNWIYLFGKGGYPAAGLNSTAVDLAQFLVALEQGDVLQAASLGALWEEVMLGNGRATGYGLGWTVGRHRGRIVVGHEGGGASWIAHFPEERLALAVLCNLNGARADEIQYGIADLVLR